MSAAAQTSPGWEELLDPGERILWQGRPDGAVVLRPRNMAAFLFGLAFAGFALFWMVMAAQAGGMFWAFGLIHFSIGLALSFGALFWGAFRRRRSWYTLTDRRAFIATDMPLKGKQLQSYPITDDTALRYDEGELDSVWFAHDYRSNKNGSTRVDIGFERISEGEKVYRLMRDIQRGAA